MVALSESARALFFGAGTATRVAGDLRYRVPFRARRFDHPALRDLCSLRGLYRAGPHSDDPNVQRHAELALDGLRPRDGEHADSDGGAAAAVVSLDLQASRRRHRLGVAGLRVPGDRADLVDRAALVRLYRC